MAMTSERTTAAADMESDSPLGERRHGQRFRTVYRVARVRTGGDEGLARVHNISDQGLMLQLGLEVAVGDPIHIALSETLALEGRIAWRKAGRCGVRLAQPIDSAGVLRRLAAETRAGMTRPPRLPLSRVALAATDRGLRAVRLRDISQRGLKVSHDGSFTPGLRVKVTIDPGLERRGVVRWSHDGLAGVQLTEPFTVQELGSVTALWEPPVLDEPEPAADHQP